jgi:hypothetical protein
MDGFKQIIAHGTMSNLVGLHGIIWDKEGKIKYTIYVLGKADDSCYLIQVIDALVGEGNTIRLVELKDMMEWHFYDSIDMINEVTKSFYKRDRNIYNFTPIS